MQATIQVQTHGNVACEAGDGVQHVLSARKLQTTTGAHKHGACAYKFVVHIQFVVAVARRATSVVEAVACYVEFVTTVYHKVQKQARGVGQSRVNGNGFARKTREICPFILRICPADIGQFCIQSCGQSRVWVGVWPIIELVLVHHTYSRCWSRCWLVRNRTPIKGYTEWRVVCCVLQADPYSAYWHPIVLSFKNIFKPCFPQELNFT